MTKETVGIIYADITNSMLLHSQTLEGYNSILCTFHTLAYDSIASSRAELGLLGDEHFYVHAFGDQIMAVIGGADSDNLSVKTLIMAIRLKQAWDQSELAQQLRHYKAIPNGLVVDLSMGVALGEDIFKESVLTGRQSVEGIWMSRIKMIPQLAETYNPRNLTLVTSDIKQAAEAAKLEVVFGQDPIDLSEKDKGWFIMHDNVVASQLYPILSYPQLVAT